MGAKPKALLAPAGTPREIITRLNRETVTILTSADSRKNLAHEGAEVVASSPEEFASTIKSEMASLGKLVTDEGIRDE